MNLCPKNNQKVDEPQKCGSSVGAKRRSNLLYCSTPSLRTGWQVCWCEAISSLHIPVGVGHSEEIASLTTFARNDFVGLQTRNDAIGLFARNDAPFVIASPSLLVIARSEATKQSPKNSNSSLQFCVYSKKKIQLYKTKIVVNCLSMVPFFVH